MLLITIASADRDSGPRGARLLGPLLRWLLPSLAEEAIDVLVLIARKLVHFVVFGILALLILRGLAARAAGRLPARIHALALALTIAFAVFDEIHQTFVPARVGSPVDVLIDSLGAAAALAGARRIGRRRCS